MISMLSFDARQIATNSLSYLFAFDVYVEERRNDVNGMFAFRVNTHKEVIHHLCCGRSSSQRSTLDNETRRDKH